MVKYSIVQLH